MKSKQTPPRRFGRFFKRSVCTCLLAPDDPKNYRRKAKSHLEMFVHTLAQACLEDLLFAIFCVI